MNFVLYAFDMDGYGLTSEYTITRTPAHGTLYYNATGPKTYLNKDFTAAIRVVQVRSPGRGGTAARDCPTRSRSLLTRLELGRSWPGRSGRIRCTSA